MIELFPVNSYKGTMLSNIGSKIKEVALLLLGPPNEKLSKQKEMRYGRHGSLQVRTDTGYWTDFESGKKGGVLDLIQCKLNVNRKEAFQWLVDQGLSDERSSQLPSRRQSRRPQKPVLRPNDQSSTGTHQAILRAQELWNKAEVITERNQLPVTGWFQQRNLWPDHVRAPDSLRLLQGSLRAIVACMAPIHQWLNVFPDVPSPTGVHLVYIDATGNPIKDKGGLNKRSIGKLTEAYWMLGELTNRIHIVEGMADGLALGCRIGETIICTGGTSGMLADGLAAGLSRHLDHYDSHRVFIWRDNDQAGLDAAKKAMNHFTKHLVNTRILRFCKAKDTAEFSQDLPLPKMSESVLNAFQERAAINSSQGGLSVAEAERLAFVEAHPNLNPLSHMTTK